MKFANILAGLLCTTVLFCGCVKDNSAAIKVNDKVITKNEFYSDFDKLKESQFKNMPKDLKADNSYLTLSLKSKLVNDMIFRELLSQEFEKRKIEATKEEIAAQKAQIIAQIGSEEKLKKILDENKISNERLEKDLASEVKTIKLLEQLNVKKTTPKDAQNYYNKNKSKFDLPERILVSHILIDTNEDNIKRKIVDEDKNGKLSNEQINSKVKEEVAKQQELLKKVLSEAKKDPKNFAKLAQQYSQDTESAKNGGNLGYAARGQFVPEFEKAAFNLKVGVVSEPVKTQFGEHIILVSDKAKKGLQPFEQVKNDLIVFLDQQNKMETLQKFADGLKAKSTIVFVDESLDPQNIQKEIDKAIQKQLNSLKQQENSNKELKPTQEKKEDKK